GLGGTLTLATTLRAIVTPDEGPPQPLSSQELGAQIAWGVPQPTLAYGDEGYELRLEGGLTDDVRLSVCPEDDPPHHDDKLQTRVMQGADVLAAVRVTTRYYWPPGPRGVSGGYTAPLKRWVETTI